MAEEVSVRDFKARLSYYLGEIEKGKVFMVRGMEIGRVDGDVDVGKTEEANDNAKNDKGLPGISPEKFLEFLEDIVELEDEVGIEERMSGKCAREIMEEARDKVKVPEYMKCKICRKYKKDEMWEGEEDGLEFVVCEECVKVRWGVRYKQVLGGMRKVLDEVVPSSVTTQVIPVLRMSEGNFEKVGKPMWKVKKEKKDKADKFKK